MLIVGAGEAGARAAMALRENGFAGPVTLIGEETHGPYERPPLSKTFITDAGAPRRAVILDEARLAERFITYLPGQRVIRIDRAAKRVILADHSERRYGRLLLATGARPRKLAVPGADTSRVLYLRTFTDALAIRERLLNGGRLVVLGAGFIGLEIAASAMARGYSVTVVEMAPRILMRGVPAELSEIVRGWHEKAGVVFRLGVTIERIEHEGKGEIVVLADGTRLICDTVIAGVGAVPETDLASVCGLAIDNGIAVDSRLCSVDPDIFAPAIAARFRIPLYGGRRLRLEAWRNAQDQGNFVARSMLGATEPYHTIPWFWSDQYEQTLQVAGLPDEASKSVVRDIGDGAKLFFHLAADGRLVAASGLGPNRLIGREIRLGEMLIERRARPDPAMLASPTAKLKALLAA